MKKTILLILFLLPVLHSLAQSRHTVRGKIIDADSGLPVAGATVYDRVRPGSGVASGTEGEFTLTIAVGNTIVCSCIGYQTLDMVISAQSADELILRIKPDTKNIEQVVVSSKSSMERVSNVQIGVERIEIAEMARVPALFGERDIIRTLQLLPGVKAEGDGSSGFQVRGGKTTQNLILLDDATVYNAGHLLGMFSTFNDDAVAGASLYKGQIPAQYGGATSSVFEANTKSGDMQRYRVDGSIGILSAKLNVEGPIAKDKASFFVAARRTYLDLFLKLTDDYSGTTLNFYDINAKVNYNISDRDKLFISVFNGQDNLGLEDLMTMKWKNTTATVRWFRRFNSRLYSNTSLLLSSFSSDNGLDILDTSMEIGNAIRQAGVKESFTWNPGSRHEVKFGYQTTYIDLKSAEWDVYNYPEREKRNSWENTLWINEQWSAGERLTISAGLRLNAFSVLGGAPYYRLDEDGDIAQVLDYGRGTIVKTHFTVEPRFSLNYRITHLQSLKAGYSATSQNIHALHNESFSMPFDRYTMSSNIIKPQTAHQFSIGYVRLTKNEKFEFSAEAYYKAIDDVLDYKDGKSFSSEIEIERLILAGKGRSYGAEFYARKNSGKLTGWVSYTLSWSRNKIPGINGDKWYTAGNDRRHDISVVGMYELPRGWQMAATWVYNTGQALSAPSAKYGLNGEMIYYYAERNGYRAPDYHRLDVSATHTKKKRRYTREWSIGVYNLYNRYNPFIITYETDDTKASGTKTVQTSLFGIIPSVSYNFKF